MWRWLEEFRQPVLKCGRVGHVERERTRQAYVRPDPALDLFWTRYVAVRVVERQTYCGRCGLADPWKQVDRRGLNGLTMPSAMHDQLRLKGRVEI